MKLRKFIFIFLTFTLFGVIIFAITSDFIVENSANGRTYFKVEKIPHNKVGMVLGTSKYRVSGGINLYFKYRVDAAVRLFESGKIDYILVSADNSKYHNEPLAFKNALIAHGVPENKIILDNYGFRTLDSVIRASKVFDLIHVTIISQKFHNERAIYLAKENGLDAIGYNAKDVSISYGFKTQIREYLARCKAILDVIFNVSPHTLKDTPPVY